MSQSKEREERKNSWKHSCCLRNVSYLKQINYRKCKTFQNLSERKRGREKERKRGREGREGGKKRRSKLTMRVIPLPERLSARSLVKVLSR